MDAAQNNQTPTEVDPSTGRRLSPQTHPHKPLAPLEYLQNQRRGSITDPSLHASSSGPSGNHQHHYQHQQQARSQEQRGKRSPRTFRPTSPFVFGDASVHPPDLSNPSIRRLLRSPSNEALDPSRSPDRSDDSSRTRDLRATSVTPEYRQPNEEPRSWSRHDTYPEKRPAMDIGHNAQEEDASFKSRVPPNFNRSGSGAPITEFDFTMRRHSIAEHPVPHHGMHHPSDLLPTPSQSPTIPSLPQGLKRKMSSDRALHPMEEEDLSYPRSGHPEIQGPAPKRRGSAFDTRIAQLSLYDRRDSIDSRMPIHQPPPQWWSQDRRDSSASMFSNASMTSAGGYSSSGFSGESAFPPRQGLTNMAWPPPHPGTASNHEAEAPMPGVARQLQQRAPADDSLSSFPPGPPIMPPDRRMSVPELSMAGLPQRNLRSRSRAPVMSRTSERQPSSNPSDADGMAEDSETSPTQANMMHSTGTLKDGTSPYSRSPELRVSHKLAERKRRKEMKDLFDELRDHLPADRGMKASKWEILTKAVDYISTLKTQQLEMGRELEMLRREVQVSRSSNEFQQSAAPNHPHNFPHVNNAYGQPSGLQPPQVQHPSAESTSGT
ncbi:hypothetical protein M422DRAFT_238306 [Sphaerobolus stellatus SS14]|nr:hypothetical protein M422DRAFT_238306 [Sphaerobolus stellatus SS14]